MALSVMTREPAIVYGEPPRVNLLPPAEKDRRDLVKLKRRWITAVLAVFGLCVVVFLGALGMRVTAQMAVGDAEDQRAELQQDLAMYADISTLVAERDALTRQRGEAMAADLRWSTPYELLSASLPRGAVMTGFAAATGGTNTADPAEIGIKGVATVVSGQAIDQAIVLDTFAQVDHVLDVDMLGLAQDQGVYTYKIYVAFDQAIYNTRFQAQTPEAAAQEDGQ